MRGLPEHLSIEEAAAEIVDGSHVGFGGGNALWRRPMCMARALVRRDARDLSVHCMIAGIESDLLIGAGCVSATHASSVGLDPLGHSEHFQEAVRVGAVQANEYTEFGFIGTLRAASMNLPYLPWKPGAGSDVVRELGWTEVECPYTGTSLVAVPAAEIDWAVIQVNRCDADGNVEIFEPHDFIYDLDLLVARAARRVIVCTEEVAPLSSPSRCGLIGREVDYVVEAPKGAWPGGMVPRYGLDEDHLESHYLPASRSAEEMRSYMDRFVVEVA